MDLSPQFGHLFYKRGNFRRKVFISLVVVSLLHRGLLLNERILFIQSCSLCRGRSCPYIAEGNHIVQ